MAQEDQVVSLLFPWIAAEACLSEGGPLLLTRSPNEVLSLAHCFISVVEKVNKPIVLFEDLQKSSCATPSIKNAIFGTAHMLFKYGIQ